jgi:hypothetical protein
MNDNDLNRRDFNRLTMAAFGGMLAGTAAGCAKSEEETTGSGSAVPGPSAPPSSAGAGSNAAGGETEQVAGLWLGDIHVCRGLNACEGKGADGKNKCAGQGSCATAKHHTCHELNDCKAQGGCGEHPGENECNQKGECGVPLSQDVWAKARASFEKAMQAAGKTPGKASSET